MPACDAFYTVFRVTAGNKISAYDTFNLVGHNDDDDDNMPCGCRTTDGRKFCDRHYRSGLLDRWGDLNVDKVMMTILLEGVKQSSLPEMFWESVSCRGLGVGECPLASGGQLGAGYLHQEGISS
jgi:hypothetical protein